MKENLTCNQCPGIVCADTTEGKRYITQVDKMQDGRWIEFPRPVAECKIRTETGVYGESEWHVPDGRPDLTMPIIPSKP